MCNKKTVKDFKKVLPELAPEESIQLGSIEYFQSLP